MSFDSSSHLVVHFVADALHQSYGVLSDGSHCICPRGTLFFIGRDPFRELSDS